MIAPHAVPNPVIEIRSFVEGIGEDGEQTEVEDVTRQRELDHCPDCGRGLFGANMAGVDTVVCGQLEAWLRTVDFELAEGDMIACGERPGT